jgi:hypothetical protein
MSVTIRSVEIPSDLTFNATPSRDFLTDAIYPHGLQHVTAPDCTKRGREFLLDYIA